MFRLRLACVVLVLLGCSVWALATIGSFRGKIVTAPAGQAREGWVFVQAPNGRMRLGDIQKAQFAFDEDLRVPPDLNPSAKLLLEGAEIRVVGEQQQGEWRATRVEIIRLAAATRETM